MAAIFTPGLKVTEHGIVHKDRRLPLEGEVMVKVGKIFLIYDDGGDVQGGQNMFFPFKNEMVVVVIRSSRAHAHDVSRCLTW